jgi:predicted DsbA family dithiol-disulfide isomerase
MHDKLFENQRALEPSDLTGYAKGLSLDMGKFQECMDSGKYADKIKNDMVEGQKAGIRGTPGFLIGVTDPNGSTVKVVKIIRGAQPYNVFKETIDETLKTKN